MAKLGPLSGEELEKKYLLGELLGEGGYGAVYKAQHLHLHRHQAVKVLLERHFHKEEFRERFLREARTVAALDHPNIVHVDDFWVETPRAYLVMPFIGEGTLQNVLQKPQKFLDLEQVVSYLEYICTALDYAHLRGVVHLDLKPLNLLIHEDGRVLLSDFGLAHLMKQGMIEGGPSLGFGTPHYMAPEHIQGRPERRSDLFSLGVILYQMLVGRRPFEGPLPEAVMTKIIGELPLPPRAFRPDLPQGVEEVSRIALAKQPEQRYQTASELLVAFKAALVAVRKPMVLAHDLLRGPSFAKEPTQEVVFNQQKEDDVPPERTQQEYQEALEAYEQALVLDPNSYSALYGRGQMLYKLKRYGEALISYERAILLEPTQAQSYYGKSFLLRDLKRYREALGVYLQALYRDPRSPLVHYQEGVTCLRRSERGERYEYGKALSTFEQVLQLNPIDTQAYVGKGTALYALAALGATLREAVWSEENNYMRMDASQTLISCDEALRRDPVSPIAHSLKGIALYHLSCYEEALVTFEQAIRLAPYKEDYQALKLYALLRLDRQEEVLTLLKESRYFDKDIALILCMDADHFFHSTQRYEEALIAFEQAISLDPTNVYAHLGKRNTLLALGRNEAAQAALEQAELLDKAEVQAMLPPTPSLRKRGLKMRLDDLNWSPLTDISSYIEGYYSGVLIGDSAVRHLKAYENRLQPYLQDHFAPSWYRQAVQLDPNNTLAQTCSGFALYHLAWYTEAIAAYEQALRLDPKNFMALIGRGLALHKSKQYQEALAAFEQALRLHPNDATIHAHRGSILYDLAEYSKALAAYEMATQLNYSNTLAWIGKSLALHQLARLQETFRAYEQALRLRLSNVKTTKDFYDLKESCDSKDCEEAFATFELAQSEAQLSVSRGNVAYNLQYYQEAIRAYEKAASIDTQSVPVLIDRLISCHKILSQQGSSQAFSKVALSHPADSELSIALSYSDAGLALYYDARYQDALAACEIALSRQPRNVRALIIKGTALRRLACYEEALTAYDEAIRIDSKSIAAYQNKGNLLLEDLKRYEDAAIVYEQAFRLGSSLAILGKENAFRAQRAAQRAYQEIVKAYERATRLEPRNASVYTGKGYSLSHLGHYQEALEAFQQAINLDPKSTLAYYGKADALDHLKRLTEAQQAYQMALQFGYNEFIMTGEERLTKDEELAINNPKAHPKSSNR